jgi:hypothetical protein
MKIREGKLVLVEVNNYDAINGLSRRKDTGKMMLYPVSQKDHNMAQYLRPAFISETETIEVGDIAVETLLDGSKMLIQIDNLNDIDRKNQVKVLFLPDQIEDLMAIVNGKIKEGDIVELIDECCPLLKNKSNE